MSENEPAQMIEGRYRIVRNIAEGGMATVYEAIDERLGRTVAIKVMHTQLAKGPHREQFVERFRREANSAASIANPHIVQVYDTGEFNGLDFLVMEYVHGVNLRHEMNAQGTFSVRETLRVVAETLDGLASAHRAGVVHRDIKPENILINDRGHVQITDFGLAKAASQATLSSTGMLLGTAAYLAPEMIENNQATAQGDLYSVGIMAWEMLTGKVPFDSDNPVTLVFKHVHEDVPSVATVCQGIDPSVAAFIAHLTARQVDARPTDGAAAAEELSQLAAKLPLEAWQYRLHAEPIGGDHTDATAAALVGNIAEQAPLTGVPAGAATFKPSVPAFWPMMSQAIPSIPVAPQTSILRLLRSPPPRHLIRRRQPMLRLPIRRKSWHSPAARHKCCLRPAMPSPERLPFPMSRTSLPTAPGQRSSAAKTAHHRTGDRAGTGCNRRNRRLVVVCRTGQLLECAQAG